MVGLSPRAFRAHWTAVMADERQAGTLRPSDLDGAMYVTLIAVALEAMGRRESVGIWSRRFGIEIDLWRDMTAGWWW